MAGASIAYVRARIYPSAVKLANWSVAWDVRTASGHCPRCDHQMSFTWPTQMIQMSPGAVQKPITRQVDCSCGQNHADGTETKQSCGAFWFPVFHPPGSPAQVTAQADPKVIAAADAFQKAVDEQEPRLRGAAEKWVAGVASLLALFGIASSVADGKVLESLTNTPKIAVAILAGLAVVLAIVAIVSSYLAAYGWPRQVDIDDDDALVTWYDGRQSRLNTAAGRLRWAVIASVASICFLMGAAGTALFCSSTPANPAPKATVSSSSSPA